MTASRLPRPITRSELIQSWVKLQHQMLQRQRLQQQVPQQQVQHRRMLKRQMLQRRMLHHQLLPQIHVLLWGSLTLSS